MLAELNSSDSNDSGTTSTSSSDGRLDSVEVNEVDIPSPTPGCPSASPRASASAESVWASFRNRIGMKSNSAVCSGSDMSASASAQPTHSRKRKEREGECNKKEEKKYCVVCLKHFIDGTGGPGFQLRFCESSRERQRKQHAETSRHCAGNAPPDWRSQKDPLVIDLLQTCKSGGLQKDKSKSLNKKQKRKRSGESSQLSTGECASNSNDNGDMLATVTEAEAGIPEMVEQPASEVGVVVEEKVPEERSSMSISTVSKTVTVELDLEDSAPTLIRCSPPPLDSAELMCESDEQSGTGSTSASVVQVQRAQQHRLQRQRTLAECFLSSETALHSEDPEIPNEPTLDAVLQGIRVVAAKVDKLAERHSSMSCNSCKCKGQDQSPLTTRTSVSASHVQVRSLRELLEKTEMAHFSLLPSKSSASGTSGTFGAALLRCTLCFTHLQDQAELPLPNRLDGVGLVLSEEQMAKYESKSDSGFRQFRNRLEQHSTCELHIKAQLAADRKAAQLERNLVAATALVTSALTIINIACAATHYETIVAAMDFVGVTVGEMQHGRKACVRIWQVADTVLMEEVLQSLNEPLPSTSLPPFYCLTMDKSTPGRTTNQAVMACAYSSNGIRTAYCFGAPGVYHPADYRLSGGQAKALAMSASQAAHNAGTSLSRCAGITADGQYQVEGFAVTLKQAIQADLSDSELPSASVEQQDGVDVDGEFFGVVWDPAHWLDLVFRDVKKQSGTVLRLVKAMNWLHRKIQQGKLTVAADQVAAMMENRPALKTQSFSSTRFTSSSFAMVKKTVTELAIWLETLAQNRSSLRRMDREFLEFLQSVPFIVELLVAYDVLRMFCAVMLRSQNLQLPAWQIVDEVTNLSMQLDVMRRSLLALEQALRTSSETAARVVRESAGCLPLLSARWDDIEKGLFREVSLSPSASFPFTLTELAKVADEEAEDDEDEPHDLDQQDEGAAAEMTLQTAVASARSFVTMLISALSRRSSVAVSRPINLLNTAFNITGYIGALCGRVRKTGANYQVLLRHEHAFVLHGQQAFHLAFEAARTRPSLEKLFGDLTSNELHAVWRDTIRSIVWGADADSLHCRRIIFGADCPEGRLLSMNSHASEQGKFSIDAGTGPLTIFPCEKNFLAAMYSDRRLYGMFGNALCALLDWALAKGCPEAIVESLYTSMDRQRMQGALQADETLELRTRLSWHIPPSVSSMPVTVKKIARLWLRQHNVYRQRGMKRKAKLPVLMRKKSETGRLLLK